MSQDIMKNELDYYADLLGIDISKEMYNGYITTCNKSVKNLLHTICLSRYYCTHEKPSNLILGNTTSNASQWKCKRKTSYLPLSINALHYYIDLLRMDETEERSEKHALSCVLALNNVIHTMSLSRHKRICREDFSKLDFGHISLNEIDWSMNGEVPSSFYGSYIHESSFIHGYARVITASAWTDDGRYFVTGDDNGLIIIWDARSGGIVHELSNPFKFIRFISFLSLQNHFISISYWGEIVLWKFQYGRCIKIHEMRTRKKHKADNCSVSAHGIYNEFCLLGFHSNKMELWNIRTAQLVRTFKGVYRNTKTNRKIMYTTNRDENTLQIDNSKIRKRILAFSNDLQKCLVGTTCGLVQIWDTVTGKCLKTLNGHTERVFCGVFSFDGKYCITGSDDTNAIIWNAITGECIHVLEEHINAVCKVAFSENGKYCLTGSAKGSVVLWDVETGQHLHSLRGHIDRVFSLEFSKDDKYCLTSACDHFVRIWEINSGDCLNEINVHGYHTEVLSLALSSNKKYCLFGSSDESVKIWDFQKRKIDSIIDNIGYCVDLSFFPDGKSFITWSLGGGIASIIDFSTRKCIRTFEIPIKKPGKIVISFNGEIVAFIARCGLECVLLFTKTGRVKRIDHHVYSFSFSPDGKYYLFGSDDDSAYLCSIETNIYWILQEQDLFSKFTSIEAVAFSPDGKHCLIGDQRGRVYLWDIASKPKRCKAIVRNKVPFSTFRNYGSFNCISALFFSSDGKTFFAQNGAGLIKQWKTKSVSTIRRVLPCFSSVYQLGNVGREYPFVFSKNIGNDTYKIKVWKLDLSFPKERRNKISKINRELFELYDIRGINIKQCDFRKVFATDLAKKIICQYGGEIDETEVN